MNDKSINAYCDDKECSRKDICARFVEDITKAPTDANGRFSIYTFGSPRMKFIIYWGKENPPPKDMCEEFLAR